jgi:hypothetical protein
MCNVEYYDKEFLFYKLSICVQKLSKFQSTVPVLLLQIQFGSGAAPIRNNFFRILFRILPKVSNPSGSGSTTLLSTKPCTVRGCRGNEGTSSIERGRGGGVTYVPYRYCTVPFRAGGILAGGGVSRLGVVRLQPGVQCQALQVLVC